ncbi:SMP-30/gluconolactonase/LRE family protein [Cohnella thermotolerans]|uniref:SMP-30/gluconolactonase/LRE family protein n=1 Tax=Cohnella thermotolerans TaxID=329858 RepID=UPI0003FA185B|nr:SMP-30/gluconolactonase/LRE family protein [Cohnella thermotolerans]
MNSRWWLRVSAAVLAAALTAALKPAAADAYSPYATYYKDAYQQYMQIQSAYRPAGVIGFNLGAGGESADSGQAAAGEEPLPAGLSQPQDLFVDRQDRIYIADTGNNRIVKLDRQGNLLATFAVKESPLSSPSGLFVDDNGDIYVADTGNRRVVKLDPEGRLLREYGRPESSYLPDSFQYQPTKLVVDKRGFLYVTTLGAFQGLLELDPEGRFQTFFGANKVAFTLFDAFKRLVYTRRMYQRELSKLPGAIVNTAIDDDGFIYTVTKDIRNEQVKKFNIAGLNQLETGGEFEVKKKKKKQFGEYYGDLSPPAPVQTTSSSASSSSSVAPAAPAWVPAVQLQDIAVDRDGNFTVIDAVTGTISQYDGDGSLLFFWNGTHAEGSPKLGIVDTPAAIATTADGDLLVLDSVNGLIQRLQLTEFGSLVHQANSLTRDGRYAESEPLWAEVYRQNAYYTPALIGLAKAAYEREDYSRAKELFYKAGVNKGYSDAFWQLRLVWFQRHFAFWMDLAIGVLLAAFLLHRFTRNREWRDRLRERLRPRHKLILQLNHVRYLVKHPIDGYHAIRYQGKAGAVSSLIVLAAAVASFSWIEAGTSFTFNTAVYKGVNLGPLLVQFAGIWLGWVVSNYLVSSLMRGEGRFRDVFYGSCYALLPIIALGVPLTILSHALTLSEKPIFDFLQLAMLVWTALQFFWMVQGIQNYNVGEALLNMLFSLLTLAMIAVLIFIFVSLSGELIDFIYSIYQEVAIR